jgi:hypothetical protein
MLREKLNQLFTLYDPTIQKLISEVLMLEQAYISMKTPHIKDQIDQIVSRVASKELEQSDGHKD